MSGFDVTQSERVLFVFTHPDDELVLAAFIKRLIVKSIPIHVCWTHSTPLREKESRAVFSLLGLSQSDLTFFDAPDGRVLESIPSLLPLMKGVIVAFAPTRVYVNAFEQGHIDHDATNLLANLCFNGPIFEAPLYHTYLKQVPVLNRFSSREREEVITLTSEEIALQRKLINMYPSQTVQRNMLLYSILKIMQFQKPDLFGTERCRLQVHKDFLTPNHSPELATKIVASELWKRWVGVVRPMIISLSSD